MRALIPILAMSGAAALVHELCWVRQMARLCGGTVVTAAVVTGVFVGGLGLGAAAGGWWADRRPRDGLRAAAIAELVAGLWALGLVMVVPAIELAPSWTPGPNGWLWPDDLPVRIGLVGLLLGPPAVALGAALPLVLRVWLPGVRRPGAAAALLVAANTLGAAAGALGTDLWLVPAFGLATAQVGAALTNIVAAVALGALAVRGVGGVDPAPAPGRPAALGGGHGLHPVVSGLALFLGGAVLLGLEVVWFRFLGSALGHFRAVLAGVLVCVLFGLWGGASAAGLLQRWVSPARLWAWALAVGVLLTLVGFALHDPQDVLEAQLAGPPLWANLRTTAALVLPASVAFGAGLPLALAATRTRRRSLGRTMGALLAACALGNLVGAVLTGLVLLPGHGVQGALTILGWTAVAALLLLALGWLEATEWRRASPLPGGLVPLLVAVLAVWWLHQQPADRLLRASFPEGRLEAEGVLQVAEGPEHTVVVTGDPEGPARLWTSGHPMASTTLHAQRYMRFLAHLPLLLQDEPQRALIICFGVGNTTHAASLHPSIVGLDVADLSETVLGQATHFAHANQQVLDDPRTTVFVDDGRRLLTSAEGPWDLIALEPPPIGYAGVSTLYARELYASARRRLTPTGCLSQWAPLYQVDADAQLSLVRAFAEVFPDGALFVADRRELVLVGCREGASRPSLASLEARLADRPEVAADLARVGLGGVADLVERFGSTGLVDVTDGTEPVTLDRPLLEHSQTNQVTETHMPATLFDPAGIAAWCHDCPVPDSARYDEDFLRFSNRP